MLIGGDLNVAIRQSPTLAAHMAYGIWKIAFCLQFRYPSDLGTLKTRSDFLFPLQPPPQIPRNPPGRPTEEA